MQTITRSVVKWSNANKTEEPVSKAKQLKDDPLKIELTAVKIRN